MAALRFVERLSGTLYWLTDPLDERAVTVEIDAHLRNLRTRIANVTGHITIDGMGTAPLQGTLGLHLLHDRRVPYDLAFTDDRNRTLRFRGEKDLSWLAPVETLAVLPFTIGFADGHTWRELARGTARFDRTLSALARSVRLAPI